MKPRLLIVDDEPLVRKSLARALASEEVEIETVGSVAEAREHLEESRADVMLIDYRLGDGTGIELLEHVRESAPETLVIILTAYGNIQLAVEAIQKGAYDFLQKGTDPEIAVHAVTRALEQIRLRRKLQGLEQERLRRRGLPKIVDESDAMKRLLATARDFARSDVTVLLHGETGTGKSLIAELIHLTSTRRDGPIVTINCSAIPRELIESELFGYAEGAFTGASRRGKPGLIARADGGTCFLDEIGDLDADLQSKLLLVLERGEILSVGATEPHKVDVRFVAATNADLQAKLESGDFRWDLYYRLNVGNLEVPPLRRRRKDILPLARQFLSEMAVRFDKPIQGFTEAAERHLETAGWPGNVRELRNTIERCVLLFHGERVDVTDLDAGAGSHAPRQRDRIQVELPVGTGKNLLEDGTRRIVEQAWELSGGNQSRAAELLGIPRTTLQHHLRKRSRD